MTGSSQYKFGILAKIVKYLKVSMFSLLLGLTALCIQISFEPLTF